ncbi:MAG: DNA polymerase III subunit delta [Schleiferiaceae bacterium]
MAHSFDSILSEIKNKTYRPIYFLMGEEAFFIDQVVDAIEHTVLDEAEKGFNQTVLYGKDTDMVTIVSEAKRYPMMAPYHVVIVKEAQQIRSFDALEGYLENPSPTTILVFAHKYKNLDKRKKVGKLLAKNHVMLESKKLYDNQVPSWIESRVKSRGFLISNRSSALLANQVGSDLARLSNELDKLFGLLQHGTEITPDVIEENIGISKEYNNFELITAIAHKDGPKVFTILKYFERNPKDNPPVLTLGILFNYFSKVLMIHGSKGIDPSGIPKLIGVNPYFVKDYQLGTRNYSMGKALRVVKYLREYDGKIKGIASGDVSGSELMRELHIKILY